MFQKTPQTRYKQHWTIYYTGFDVAEPDERIHNLIKGQGHQENKMASTGTSRHFPKPVETRISSQVCSVGRNLLSVQKPLKSSLVTNEDVKI